MKTPIRAVLPLSTLSVPQKVTTGTFANQEFALHGDEFPKTAPNSLDKRQAVVARLSAARYELEAAETEFDELFGAYRNWANQPGVALGSKERINKLGLAASSGEAQRAARPAAPLMKEVRVVGPGCILAACQALAGTLVYTYFVAYGATEPDLSELRFLGNYTTARQELAVESGQRPWIRVMATNPAGMSEYSAALGLAVV
jgi:hypothetical protein